MNGSCPDCLRTLHNADGGGQECTHCGYRTNFHPDDAKAIKDDAIAAATAATAAVRARENPPKPPTPKPRRP